MIDVLKQQVTSSMTAEERTNRAREFLQILILKILSDKGYFRNLAFVGGTALRILYDLRRFSEDLDFSLLDKKRYRFSALLRDLEKELRLFGLDPELKARDEKTVQSAYVKFRGLFAEIGIPAPKDQKLSISVAIETNPPAGARTEKSLVNRTYLFDLQRFDLPSLYSTKLHACFFRKYTKGRDYYDLVWYLGKKMEPNYTLLNNAIAQTEGHHPGITKARFAQFILDRLKEIDFRAVRRDVERFLEDKSELNLLYYDRLEAVIRSH